MLLIDVDKSKPHTTLTVKEPVRLACLSFAGFARGVYTIQGDFRSKITKPHDKRLVQVGLISLSFSTGEIPEALIPIPQVVVPEEPVAPVEPPVEQPAQVIERSQADTWSPDEPAVAQQPQEYPLTPIDPPATVVSELPPVSSADVVNISTEAPAAPTETAPVVTEVPAVVTETADYSIVGDAPLTLVGQVTTSTGGEFVVAPATELLESEVGLTTSTTVTEVPETPVVVDDASPKKNKGGRPRKLKPGNVVAPDGDTAKLPEHDQDSGSPNPVPASAEDGSSNENGQALA